MKMRYLVLGASCLALTASTAWARPTILDGAVTGHWKFDGDTFEERKVDSSGYGGYMNEESTYSSTSVKTQSSGGFSGGCLNINTKGGKAYATLGPGQTLATYHTFASWVKPDSTMTKLPTTGSSIAGFDDNVKQFALNFNDFSQWHMMIEIYQNKRISGVVYSDFCDPANLNTSPRPEAGDSKSGYPMSISDQGKVTIGGQLKGSSSYRYIGLIDEVQLINRMLSKIEVTRLYLAREAYIYPIGNISFSDATGWSNASGVNDASLCKPGAADYKAAAYIVDQTKTLTGPDAGGVFGQNTDNKVSLTLGRLTPLMDLVNNTTIVAEANKYGNFKHGATANTTTTFYDLRLNDGTITPQANGQTLTTTLLDVDAPSTKPFNVSVGQNLTYTFNAGGQVTGTGVLAKTGAGTLVLNDFVADDRSSLGYTDAPKFRMTAGSVKTAVLNGYTGGTVIIGSSPTTIASGDTISKAVAFKFETAPTEVGSYRAFALDGVPLAKNDFTDTTTDYPADLLHSVRVAGNNVYVDLETPPDPIIEWNTSGGTDVGANIDKMTLPISLKYTGPSAPAADTYPVQTIGGTKTYTAASFAIDWSEVALPTYMSAAVNVNGKVVSVVVTDNRAKLPDADKGEVPVLIGQ